MVISAAQMYAYARQELMRTEDAQTASMMARYLVSQAADIPVSALLSGGTHTLSQSQQRTVLQGIQRLKEGEPFAYVLGNWEFYGLPFYVSPDVLIPRDDTCAVTELAINQGLFLPKSPRILDLCCGSGCIGIAVASRLPDARVTLADLSPEALTVARKNIALNHMGGRVSCVRLDAMEEPPAYLGKFDMIISNPPYITQADMLTLPDSVKKYEPHMALYGGEDGLDFYRSIIQKFSSVLNDGGFLAFEFGMDQGDSICTLLEAKGYSVLERKKDFNDRQRAVLAMYSRKDV